MIFRPENPHVFYSCSRVNQIQEVLSFEKDELERVMEVEEGMVQAFFDESAGVNGEPCLRWFWR